jgi:hypothetical protein
MREPWNHSLTRRVALSAAIFASCLAAASGDAPNSRVCAGVGGPTNFDYLVLASIADSPRFLAMASYRPTAQQEEGVEHVLGAEPAIYLTDN